MAAGPPTLYGMVVAAEMGRMLMRHQPSGMGMSVNKGGSMHEKIASLYMVF